MSTLRGWLFYIVLAITLIPVAIVVILMYPLPLAWRYRVGASWARFILWCADALCGVRYEVKGMENFPKDNRPVLVLSKHQSAWEVFWMISHVPNHATFVYKRELHYVPVFGQAIATLKMIAIDRKAHGRAYEQVLKQSREKIAQGWSIVMFPEGTRTAPGEENPHYKSGGARLAVATGLPIVPIALNSGQLWPRNSIAKKPGMITVSVGPMIESTGKDFDEVQTELVDWIETEMRRISPEAYAREATRV
ncbi:MAG TPA: 1-acyl-sn-glycerol-3-phosphate acyltransferase [Candidatus Aphodousia faecipullorum]|nr:1-acyl-sn-glycerol-3-phosphate acyltransferase [Candidatus Aphodousia faecipullorum]